MTNPAPTPTPTPGPAQEPPKPTWDELFKDQDPVKVKEALENSRKWESRAKENKSAADKLAAIEEAQKTESQKAADRLAAVEAKAAEAERRAVRSEIATEFALSPEDAKALEHVTSEDGMRVIAGRLAAKAAEVKKNGNRVPREGTTPPPPQANPLSGFAARVFGRDDQQ